MLRNRFRGILGHFTANLTRLWMACDPDDLLLDADLLSDDVLCSKARNPINTGFSGKKSQRIQVGIQAIGGGRFRQRGSIIGRHGEDFAHAQVHPVLTGLDIEDAFQQLVESVWDGRSGNVGIIQALFV